MADVTTFPDVEEAAKVWLRTAHPALVGSNVFHGIPSNAPDEFITVSRIGGSPEPGSLLPIDRARISFQVWALTKARASAIAANLGFFVTHIEEEALSPSVYAYGGEVDSILWQPAADTGRPRYIVDTTITARAIAPVAP